MNIQVTIFLLLAFILLADSLPFSKKKPKEKKPKTAKTRNIEIRGTVICTPLGRGASTAGDGGDKKSILPVIVIRESTKNAGVLTKAKKTMKKSERVVTDKCRHIKMHDGL